MWEREGGLRRKRSERGGLGRMGEGEGEVGEEERWGRRAEEEEG